MSPLERLRKKIHGRVIEAADSEYDEARSVYNGMCDRRPLAVFQCANSANVMTTIAASATQRFRQPDPGRIPAGWILRTGPKAASTVARLMDQIQGSEQIARVQLKAWTGFARAGQLHLPMPC